MNSAAGGRPRCRQRAWWERHQPAYSSAHNTQPGIAHAVAGLVTDGPHASTGGCRPCPKRGNACNTTDTGVDHSRIRLPDRTAAIDARSPPDQRSQPMPAGPGDPPASTGPDEPDTDRRSGWSARNPQPRRRACRGSDHQRRAPAHRPETPYAPPHPGARPGSATAAWRPPRRLPRLILIGQPSRSHQGAPCVFDLQVRVRVAGGGHRCVPEQTLHHLDRHPAA
jgi:hypothetical protein